MAEPHITCAIAALRPAVFAVDALGRGVDSSAVLAAAGIVRAQLAAPEERVPYTAFRAAWETAAALAQTPSFGARAALSLPAGTVDVIDYIVKAAGRAAAREQIRARPVR